MELWEIIVIFQVLATFGDLLRNKHPDIVHVLPYINMFAAHGRYMSFIDSHIVDYCMHMKCKRSYGNVSMG